MSYLENRMNKNKDFIKQQIDLKNSSNPYFVNQSIYSIRNEYDEFPYPKWFKGIAESEKPIIADREAGWIPKRTKPIIKKEVKENHEHCFQTACSTIYPCYSQDNSYLFNNKACINLGHQ
jgi:hypothetical protein